MSVFLMVVTSYAVGGPGKIQTIEKSYDETRTAMVTETDMQLTVNTAVEDGKLQLSYSMVNGSGQDIFVFDTLYDMATRSMNPDWYYASVENDVIVIARQVWPLPQGLAHSEPEVPYGRWIEAGHTASGQFAVALPVKEEDPYHYIVHSNDEPALINVSKLQFRLGWCTVSDMPDDGWVKWNEVDLYYFDYHTGISQQAIAASTPNALSVDVEILRPGQQTQSGPDGD
ncbi:MAG TPA: hypothetical protein VJ984_14255 [Xanthomonadales bacterium]|nr:hypothetical protein [Xanthomonadales bacterium]